MLLICTLFSFSLQGFKEFVPLFLSWNFGVPFLHIIIYDPVTVQFSSVTQSCPTLCDSMDASTPGFSVHHQPPELARTHVHRVGDAIQPCPPLSSPSPAINLSQGQGLFQWSSLDPAYFPNDYLCISTLLKSPIVLMVEMSPLSNVKCRDQHLIGPYFGSTLRGLWN